jgi:hypothetical protein
MHNYLRISGVVRELESRRGVSNVVVAAFDKDLIWDDLLGRAITNAQGAFEIVTESADFRDFFEKRPDIYLRISTREGREIYSTEHSIRWNADRLEQYDVAIPRRSLQAASPSSVTRALEFAGDPARLPMVQRPLTADAHAAFSKLLVARDMAAPSDDTLAPDVAMSLIVPPGLVPDGALQTILRAVGDAIRSLLTWRPGEPAPEVLIESAPDRITLGFWLDASIPEAERRAVLRALQVSVSGLLEFGICISSRFITALTERRFAAGPRLLESGTVELQSAAVALEAPDQIILVQRRTILATDLVVTRAEKMLPDLQCLATVTTDLDERALAALLVCARTQRHRPGRGLHWGPGRLRLWFGRRQQEHGHGAGGLAIHRWATHEDPDGRWQAPDPLRWTPCRDRGGIGLDGAYPAGGAAAFRDHHRKDTDTGLSR